MQVDLLKNLLTLKANITIEISPEDIPVHGFASAIDPETDKQTEDQIIADLEWNPWAWCCVKVAAHYDTFEGCDYLGACSYQSEKDFRKNSGYFEDMKRAALDNLALAIMQAELKIDYLRDRLTIQDDLSTLNIWPAIRK